MPAETFVSCETDGGIAMITLNRPPLNVLNLEMLGQLAGVLDAVQRDTAARVAVLRAEGRSFCAGVDVADHTPDRVGEMIPLFHRVCRGLAGLPIPTIAALHGHALGGGCELALCCDLAVMSEEAKIGQPEIQLAAIAPVAALRLPQMVGYRAAAEMLFSGASLSAAEAHRLGLVNAVVPPEKVGGWASDKATELSRLSRVALIASKQALHVGSLPWADDLDTVERLYLDELMSSADAAEGMAAFLEKRPPVWKHR